MVVVRGVVFSQIEFIIQIYKISSTRNEHTITIIEHSDTIHTHTRWLTNTPTNRNVWFWTVNRGGKLEVNWKQSLLHLKHAYTHTFISTSTVGQWKNETMWQCFES